MTHTGFYINLDRNPERKEKIEQELARCGLSYKRFAASEGNALHFPASRLKPGEIGCFTSHYRILADNSASSHPLHIIEDDIILSPQVGQVLAWAIDSGQLAQFDLIYTDVAVPLLNDACHAYKNYYDATVKRDGSGKIESVAFSVIDMKELIFASTCSFLVNPHAIAKLKVFYEEELKGGARLPIDLFIRHLCQESKIKVGCIFPFVTSISPESCFATTIKERFDELPALAANMLRHSFYIGADWQALLDQATRQLPQPEVADTHRQLMMRLLGYSLTAGYKRV